MSRIQRGMGFSGFSLNARESKFSGSNPLSASNKKPAPTHPQSQRDHPTSVQPLPDPSAGRHPRFLTEDEYFNESSSESETGGGTCEKADKDSASSDSNSENEDPLDAFMSSIQDQVTKQAGTEGGKASKAVRGDIEQADDQETYFQFLEEQASKLPPVCSDEEDIDYDSDGFPIAPDKPRSIEPLPRVNHEEVDYLPFEKNFYQPHQDVENLTRREVAALRESYSLRVSGVDTCRPCISFAYLGLSEELLSVLSKNQYSQPTPIQTQALPAALAGRDLIGIAQTGSGKTLAYLLPLIVHVLDQEEMQEGEGPIGLILSPTRELCQQIYYETKRFCKPYNIGSCPIYGGTNRWEQIKALKQAPEIVISTPGRMIDLIKSKATNLQRVTFLVVDEADRMFDMGFEGQVRSLVFNVRPDRQTLMFSATFRKRVEGLAREALTDPVRVCVGVGGEASEDVTQHVAVLGREEEKWSWLTKRIVNFCTVGSLIVFVTKKADSELLVSKLRTRDFSPLLLHGDMEQGARDEVIMKFKRKEEQVLVATDVAARGLDIPHVRTVINYDVAKTIETHTHRIGRTGRAGEKGDAYTLITGKDKFFAGDLVRNLEGANQEVPRDLLQLALQNAKFRKSRRAWGQEKGKKLQAKKRLRPGLGSTESEPAPARQAGPLTSRMDMYQSQYRTNFVKASHSDLASTSTLSTSASQEPSPAPDTESTQDPSRKPKSKTRFSSAGTKQDDNSVFSAPVASQSAKLSSTSKEDRLPPPGETRQTDPFIKPPPKKKKKRWDI